MVSAIGGAACGTPTSPPLTIAPATATLARYDRIELSGSLPVSSWSVREGPEGGAVTPGGMYVAPERDGVFHVVAQTPSGSIAEAVMTVVTRDLDNLGGAVLPTPTVHVLFWGDASALPPGIVETVKTFFSNIGSSNYLGSTRQYLGKDAPNVVLGDILADGESAPTPAPGDVVSEVCAKFAVHGETIGANDIFVVYASTPAHSGLASSAPCGFHAYSVCGTQNVTILFVASAASSLGTCLGAPSAACNPLSGDATNMIATTAHELVETMTDPRPFVGEAAWIDAAGEEAADKCAFAPLQCVELSPGVSFMLPAVYSNATHTCVYR
jgi:hypothetical protein